MGENYISTEGGNIRISEEVISTIAALAAKEVDGIASMGGSLLGGIGDLITKKSQGKGVKVEFLEDGIMIELHITVKFGAKIREVSASIQEQVKNAVETMASLNVKSVNVYVDGIELEKTSAPAEVAE
ncbi:MAG: Asp23/Gls24 family envelope stress response protein [Clostridia bacterium]